MFMFKKYSYLIASIIFFVTFIIFTILVKTVDVAYISASGTYIGFSRFNFMVGNWVVEMDKMSSFKLISDILLYITLGFSLIFVVIGIIQWIIRKSLKLVDKTLYLLAASYVVIALIYLLFELVKVNYSPFYEGSLKASYPSTHVFVGSSLVLIGGFVAIKMLKISSEVFKTIIYLSSVVIALLLAFSRLLSLRHWCTDIIASILLIPGIYLLFIHFYNFFGLEERKKES